MATLKDDLVANVIGCISELIRMSILDAADAQYHNAPEDVQEKLQKAQMLRDIRTHFENVATGALVAPSPFEPKQAAPAKSAEAAPQPDVIGKGWDYAPHITDSFVTVENSVAFVTVYFDSATSATIFNDIAEKCAAGTALLQVAEKVA